jgi:flagellar basal body L-ring protein FlgH
MIGIRTGQLLLLPVLFSLAACSSLMGSLRRDFDDQQFLEEPVSGGRFSERGLLDSEEDYADSPYDTQVGHLDRSIAASEVSEADDDESAKFSRNTMGSRGDRPPTIKRKYRNGQRATRADFVDDANQNEGSLWASDGQTNYYFTKNKIRGVGDLVSVNLEEAILKDLSREIMRNLTAAERENEMILAQERLKRKAMGLPEEEGTSDTINQSAAAPARAPASNGANGEGSEKRTDVIVPEATPADINVLKSLEIKAGDSLMAEIVERYPNGNYRIRGTRKIAYRAGRSKLINFTAIAKGADISEDDQIPSGKLYEYRIEEVLE